MRGIRRPFVVLLMSRMALLLGAAPVSLMATPCPWAVKKVNVKNVKRSKTDLMVMIFWLIDFGNPGFQWKWRQSGPGALYSHPGPFA
jgi:hypothetical protein